MKTTISIPTPIFDAAEALAKRLGISRSELFTKAVVAYLEAHADDGVTKALNQIYEAEASALDPVVQQLQFISLPHEAWLRSSLTIDN